MQALVYLQATVPIMRANLIIAWDSAPQCNVAVQPAMQVCLGTLIAK